MIDYYPIPTTERYLERVQHPTKLNSFAMQLLNAFLCEKRLCKTVTNMGCTFYTVYYSPQKSSLKTNQLNFLTFNSLTKLNIVGVKVPMF